MFSVIDYCSRWSKPIIDTLIINPAVLECQKSSFTRFHTSISVQKEVANKLKGKSKSSQEWLLRQLADPYIEKAKMQNYRCRSSFKLLEMDDRFAFLSPGQLAIDCGAAPGGWTQVLVQRTNSLAVDKTKPAGRVIAVDRLPIYPIDGATTLGNADFTLTSTRDRVLEALAGARVDVLVSDMAPNATGVRVLDHENIVSLAYAALRFAVQVSDVGATALLKTWDGGDSAALERDLARFYRRVRAVKPAASRGDSAERFLLARGFRGLKT